MSKLEQLIAELCPEGVEYVALGEIGSFYGGLTGKSKEDFTDGNGKFITYMNVFSNLEIDVNSLDSVKVGGNERQNAVLIGDVLFTGSSETPDECGMSSVLISKLNQPIYLNSFCFGFRFNDRALFLPEFSKYLFRSDSLRKQIGRTASGVTRFNVSKEKMKKVIAPLPPLAIQREIVRILDNFTELTARKKQYEYYRNELLSADGEFYILNDVCNIVDCPHTSPKWHQKGIPVIRNYNLVNGHIDTTKMSYVHDKEYKGRIKRISPQKDDILFSREAPIGNVGIIPENFICCQGQRVVLLRPNKEIIIPRYLLHILQGAMVKEQINKFDRIGATVSNFNIADLRHLKLLIPEISTQEVIADKLDKFNGLCSDIVEGLPAEIEARRKQYEYYRDNLLTFKSLEPC